MPVSQEGYLPVENARIYYRETGQGQPLVVLHGGPDFDHTYLLPDLDRLADTFRLIYYDQRGRGKSASGVLPEEVSMATEVEDLERLREHFRLETAAILGHSWGGLLALEYALRHPERVSHLILMNPAPVSRADYLLLRQDRRNRSAGDLEMMKQLASRPAYQAGDPDAVAGYYRVHFRAALRQPDSLERVIRSLRACFTREGILKARAIEDRLYGETWGVEGYDLLPGLQGLRIPALVIHGEQDIVPVACAEHIARAIPGARLVVLRETGHFAYLERPEEVRQEINDFVDNSAIHE